MRDEEEVVLFALELEDDRFEADCEVVVGLVDMVSKCVSGTDALRRTSARG